MGLKMRHPDKLQLGRAPSFDQLVQGTVQPESSEQCIRGGNGHAWYCFERLPDQGVYFALFVHPEMQEWAGVDDAACDEFLNEPDEVGFLHPKVADGDPRDESG